MGGAATAERETLKQDGTIPSQGISHAGNKLWQLWCKVTCIGEPIFHLNVHMHDLLLLSEYSS